MRKKKTHKVLEIAPHDDDDDETSYETLEYLESHGHNFDAEYALNRLGIEDDDHSNPANQEKKEKNEKNKKNKRKK